MPTESFLDKCRSTVEAKPNNVFASWYNIKGQETESHTFRELWDEAGVIAYHLRKVWDIEKGDRVILCYGFGLHFFAAFLGCLRAGVVAVLVYPPYPPLTKTLPKMIKTAQDCQPRLILTDSRVSMLRRADNMNPLSKSRNLWPDLPYKETDSLKCTQVPGLRSLFVSMKGIPSAFDEESISPDDLAFLQYTSGSTGDPKGVMVTHGAFSSNIQICWDIFSIPEHAEIMAEKNLANLTFFSWLPQYHDLGLVIGISTPFVMGFRLHIMSPLDFIRNPTLWMELVSKHRVNFIMGPNFSFDLVARRFRDLKEKAPKIDLSDLLGIMNCAEPIRTSTLDNFQQVFGRHGLRDKCLSGAYGLAETVVCGCFVYGRYESVQSPGLVAVGHRYIMFSTSFKIVDPDTRQELPDGTIGEIWMSGPSIAAGYYGRPELSEEVFRSVLADDEEEFHEETEKGTAASSFSKPDPTIVADDSFGRRNVDIENNISGKKQTYLRTGDLGFFEDDYLYVCGRIKDLIIVNGVNHYPQDIEFGIQEAFAAVRPGSIAAFSTDETGGDGQLEIVFEIRKHQEKNASAVCRQIQVSLASNLGLSAFRIIAIPEKTICKTTSGKIQRRATRKKLHEEQFEIVGQWSEPLTTIVSEGQRMHAKEASTDSQSPSEKYESNTTDDSFSTSSQRSETISFDGVLENFFGSKTNPDATWEELGLTSLTMVELKIAIEGSLSVILAADCFETYPTPRQLGDFVESFRGEPVETVLEMLKSMDHKNLSWVSMSILQAIGTVLHLLMFAAGIVPAYEISKVVLTGPTSELIQANGVYVLWMWIPVSVPIWMISFTFLVIVAKWTVVGCYREGEMATTSVAFLRWWWVDRAVHLFEVWVGRFIRDTPLLWLVYFLMGAKIHPSASIDAFVREFDLVRVGPFVSLQHQIHCRKFGPCLDNKPPSLRFRAVHLERCSQVKGMVSLGAHIGKEAKVSRRAVVPEGGQVPEGMNVSGNPAFLDGRNPEETTKTSWWMIGLIKAFWLILELYFFFASIFVGQIVWTDRLPSEWRYERFTYWALLIMTSNIISLSFGVALKWSLIGKRKQGDRVSLSLWGRVTEWMTDYHFRISTVLLASMTSGSTFWNVVLMFYGMDVDLISRVYVDSFPPSKVDLVKVKRSFLAIATFETAKEDGTYAQTAVEESSIGHHVHFGPGVQLSKVIVPLLSLVKSDICKTDHDPRYQNLHPIRIALLKVMSEICYLFFIPFIWASLIPSFEFWILVNPQSVWMAVPVLAACLIVQTLSWVILLRLLELVQCGFGLRSLPFLPLYSVYLTLSWSVQNWSMLPALWGSPLFNLVAQFLGVRVEGRALYLGQSLHDFGQLTFADKVIIDGAISFGHAVVYGELSYGPNHLSGVYHDFTLNTLCQRKDNSDSAAEEHGPWRCLIGSP